MSTLFLEVSAYVLRQDRISCSDNLKKRNALQRDEDIRGKQKKTRLTVPRGSAQQTYI